MTQNDFSKLLSSVDDDADDHILWVNMSGEVFISPLGSADIETWEKDQKDFKFRWETFMSGNKYCGSSVITQQDYIQEYLGLLKNDWNNNAIGYIDF